MDLKNRRRLKILLFLYAFGMFLCSGEIYAAVTTCNQHQKEINNIRGVASESLYEAHTLTGDVIGSIVVTARDLAWDAVKSNYNYSEFATTFQGAIKHCNSKGKFLATNRLYKGFNEVGDLFLVLYNNCITNHHNYRSVFERGKIYFDRGDVDSYLVDISDLINAGYADELVKPTDVLITKAQACLESGQYEKAIEALSDVIKRDPSNKEAYFHRAAAYFETGHFDRSLRDYLSSDKGKGLLENSPKPPSDFTKALVSSIRRGAAEATVEFVPSLCSSAYGLGETLWAVHPINRECVDNIKQFAGVCYEMGECVAETCKNIDSNTFGECVDQVKILYERFDNLSDSEKGELIGFAIGKYGVDLFAGGTVVKSVAVCRKLRTANRLCTLEAMSVSKSNKKAIAKSSLKHAADREAYFRNIKIELDKQNKHVVGTHNFELGKGEFTHSHPQALLSKFAGKGKPLNDKVPGTPDYRERVDFGELIGYYVSKENPNIKLPTTKGTIRYSKKGAHIVPAHPNGK